ncbi:MAG: hypothetical protein ACOVSR_03330 [Bacteroidia bacterium]
MQKQVNYLILTSFLMLTIITSIYGQVKNEGKYTSAARLGLTVNNSGTIGRPNVRSNTSGPPSMAYPTGSGVEHLFEGGIWIGAYVNGQPRVSTSSSESSAGYSTGAANFEFTPLTNIVEKSNLTKSPNYSKSAISHQDFVMTITDSNVIIPGTSIPINGHDNPLKAVVKVEVLNWNYSYADYFVILNYTITNKSKQRWDSIYIGNFSDLVVRNVNVTRETGSLFFQRGRNFVDTKNSAIVAYMAAKNADDYNFISSYGAMQFLGVDWKGLFFNPSKPEIFTNKGFSAPTFNANFWTFGSTTPPYIGPNDEQTRFSKLAAGIDSNDLNSTSGPTYGPASNWLQLMSVGPFRQLEPDSSMTYTIAFVCAKQLREATQNQSLTILSTEASQKELKEHFNRSRSTYVGEDSDENGIYSVDKDLNKNGRLDRFVLPEPPEDPKVKIIASDKKATIYWSNNAESSVDPITREKDFEGYKIYSSKVGDDLKPNFTDARNLIGQWDSTGNDVGFNNGFDLIKLPQPITFDGDTTKYYYSYTLNNLSNGWQYLVIVTAFDKGNKKLNLEPLESSFSGNDFRVFSGSNINNFTKEDQNTKVGVYPNPYSTSAAWDGTTSRTKKLYFNNLPQSCEITIYTTSGDVIANFKHDANSYNGEGNAWFDRLSDREKTVMTGGEHAWDLLSDSKNQITQGIYMYSVKDLQSGIVQTGNFAVIK